MCIKHDNKIKVYKTIKSFLANILNLLAFSNLFVAFCAYLLYRFCLECVYGMQGSLKLDIFIFSSTLFIYLFHRKFDRKQNKLLRINNYNHWSITHNSFEIFLLLSSFLCSFYLLHIFSAIAFIVLLPIALICLTYILRILPTRYDHLRAIPFAKSGIIAFVWTVSVSILPLIHAREAIQFEEKVILFSLAIFSYILCQVIIFDLKDIQTDLHQGLKTFVTHFGARTAKKISIGLLILTLILTYLGNFSNAINFSLILSVFILSLLVWIAKSHFKPLYYYIVLESSLAYPFLFFKISKYIF